MRKIRLSDTDASLFDEEMIPMDYEYLAKHKDVFCRMWKDQGKTFWTRFVEVFRSYIVRYSLLGDLPCDASHLQHALDHGFKIIEDNYVEGKVNQAKNLLFQIADLGRNRHRFSYLDSKSVTKDPFYTKDTRDLFREFFGKASEKSSYIKVYLLTPVYMRFGGSIIRCLNLWRNAEEIESSDESYFTPPPPFVPETSTCDEHHEDYTWGLCADHLKDCNMKYYQQFVMGNPRYPVALDFWDMEDPRFKRPGNPLYDSKAIASDWRDGLTVDKFQEFYAWCTLSNPLVKPEDQCPLCGTHKKTKKKNKKKKKKAASSVTDFGYDDASIMADSGASWDGLGGGSVNRSRNALPACQCNHMPPESGKALAKLPQKQNQGSQTNLLVEKSLQTDPQSATAQKKSTAGMEVAKPADITLRKPITLSGRNMFCTKTAGCPCQICWSKQDFRQMNDTVGNLMDELAKIKSEKMQQDWSDPTRLDLSKIMEVSKAAAANESANLEASDMVALSSRTTSGSSMEEMLQVINIANVMFEGKALASNRTEVVHLPVASAAGQDMKAVFEVFTKNHLHRDAKEVLVTLTDLDYVQAKNAVTGGEDSTGLASPSALPSIQNNSRFKPSDMAFIVEALPSGKQTIIGERNHWCSVEVKCANMAEENQTHFVLSIFRAPNVPFARELMKEILFYVARRQTRPSPGWVMTEDDLFAFCQQVTTSVPQLVNSTFSIRSGSAWFEDFYTPEPPTTLPVEPAKTPAVEPAKAPAVEPAKTSTVEPPETPAVEPPNTPAVEPKKVKKQKPSSTSGDKAQHKAGKQSQDAASTASSSSGVKAVEKASAAGQKGAESAKSQSADGKRDVTEGMSDEIKAHYLSNQKFFDDLAARIRNFSHEVNYGEAPKEPPKEPPKDSTSKTLPAKPSEVDKTVLNDDAAAAAAAAAEPDKGPVSDTTDGASGAAVSEGACGQLESSKSKKKKKKKNKSKSKELVQGGEPAAEGPVINLVSVVDTSDIADNSGNCSYDDVAKLLAAMSKKGKMDGPLTHTVFQAPAEPEPVSKAPPTPLLHLGNMMPITASGDASQTYPDGRQLSVCSYCGVTEPALRTFRKCQKCVEEAAVYARYYCGKPCQQEDWKVRHGLEHAEKRVY